jgi:superfamily II DNA or RNA helicase
MAEEFDAAGIPAASVDASTVSLERQAIQRAFKNGDIRVIWSVRTMTTGVDLEVSGIIDAAPTQSAMLHQQKIGRGLRKNPGTEDLVIWDHAGNTLRLGFVTDLDWSELPSGTREEGAKRREPLPKECTSCHSLMPPKVKVCPHCGEERKPPSGFVDAEDGELVAITPEPEKRDYPKATKQLWWSGILKIASERGYKQGWAAHKYKEKFGVWPRGLMDIASEPSPEIRSWVRSRQIAFAKAREKSNA